jgi:phosphoribosylformylglycinamidine cyclo-ligase
VQRGDAVIALASSGPHSNGYSLIRKVLERSGADPDTPCGDTTLGAALMAPTRIYVRSLLSLLEAHEVHALAHITGGGLIENLPRVLPAGTRARIDPQSWSRPPAFDWLQDAGGIEDREMLRTFNCGVGMCVVVPADGADTIQAALTAAGETVWRIGRIEDADGAEPEVVTGAIS